MQKRSAVVVGIDDYREARLSSCVNDATSFARVLQIYGFDVHLLVDADATRENVYGALRAALTDIGERDRVVFYYSGKGHRAPVDGQLRECLVLHPGRSSERSRWMFDDELIDLAAGVPAGCLTVILDTGFTDGAIHTSTKAWRTADREPDAAMPLRSFAGRSATTAALNGMLITACDATGLAVANTSVTDGLSVFTYCLLDTLDHLRTVAEHINQISNRDIKVYTTQMVRDVYHGQRPSWRVPAGASKLVERSFLMLEATTRMPDHRPAGSRARGNQRVSPAHYQFSPVMQWDDANVF